MNKLFKKILSRSTEIKEYLTITFNEPIRERVYLKNGQTFIDVSQTHWPLCLEPMIFGIWLSKSESALLEEKSTSKIYFTDAVCNNNNAEKKSVAILTLTFFNRIEDEKGTLLLLKLQNSKINHLSILKTLFLFFVYYKKPAFSFQKFKSLVAAFSYPRQVYLVSYKEENYYNIFPMDLLGEIEDCNKFVFGLRHSNTTLSKIIATKKIVVSEISFKHKNIIYQLGKHHSAKPPSSDSLPFKILRTSSFDFYVPEWTKRYSEIKILNTLNLGSQMLLWGEVVNEKTFRDRKDNLFHIHFLFYLHQQKKGRTYQLVQ